MIRPPVMTRSNLGWANSGAIEQSARRAHNEVTAMFYILRAWSPTFSPVPGAAGDFSLPEWSKFWNALRRQGFYVTIENQRNHMRRGFWPMLPDWLTRNFCL